MLATRVDPMADIHHQETLNFIPLYRAQRRPRSPEEKDSLVAVGSMPTAPVVGHNGKK